MKKFVWAVVLPSVVIIMTLLGGLECYLRSIPNDYKIQKDYVESHADSLKVLVMGSSATSRGVLPRYFDVQPAYNCAYSARSIDYDYYILKKYIDSMDSLKYLVLDMNYDRLWWKMGPDNRTATYLKYYSIYWGITLYKGFDSQFEISTSFTDIPGLKYKYKKSQLEYDGYQAGGIEEYDEQKWKSHAKERMAETVLEDKVKEKNNFEDNLSCLKGIIELCQEKNVQVVMVWVPVDTIISNLFDDQRVQIINRTMDELQKEYSNFNYYDLVKDTTFNHADMMNVDHLNRQGAIKLTKMINDYINDVEKN